MAVRKLAERAGKPKRKASQALIKENYSNELFFAVVGPVGAGSSRAADALKRQLVVKGYKTDVIKASDSIKEWAADKKLELPPSNPKQKNISAISIMQNRGDDMRRMAQDYAIVAAHSIDRITRKRAEWQNVPYVAGMSVEPNGEPKAYIIDSLKHPAEAELFRRIYGSAFTLVGVVCEEKERHTRLVQDLFPRKEWKKDETKKQVIDFMKRDADDQARKWGQHVIDTFHMADFFVDNSASDPDDDKQLLNESFGRLIDIVSHARVHRPTTPETAMHMAHSSALRSMCMSRQVGAALVDRNGNIVATGTNEVPKAGGGVYGEDLRDLENDERCIPKCSSPQCASNREQNEIIDELIDAHPALIEGGDREAVIEAIRKSRIGGLLEFSRAVHAEIDAILSAARVGVSPIGMRLFVTTFPCHYCARHLISAGIYEVQYIEPYPKSKALDLHSDAIETNPAAWVPPTEPSIRQDEFERRKRSEFAIAPVPEAGVRVELPPAPAHTGKVLFRPFVGVAPRMYLRAFLKDRDYKDKVSGLFVLKEPEWGGQWGLHKLSYHQLEARLGGAKPDEG